jgi:hypothetical protein
MIKTLKYFTRVRVIYFAGILYLLLLVILCSIRITH